VGPERNTARRSVFGRAVVFFSAWLVLIAAWHVVTAPAASAAPLQYGCRSTPSGPLCPSDIDLVTRVKQACLWEIPSGEMAQTQSASPKVKQVGAQLEADHHFLDTATNEIAAQLGITLPDQPNTSQQGWLAEMRPEVGNQFDQTFAMRLRAAHGVIFSIIAQVRAGTRNDLIRSYAEVANSYVLKHMQLLESTGLVAYQALPAAPAPGAVASSGLAPGSPPGPGFVWAMLAAGVGLTLLAVIMVFRLGRPRRRQASW
jgi:putative membrane protein